MRVKLLILVIIVIVALFLVISLSDSGTDMVPEAIIEQEEAIIEGDMVSNKAKVLEATRHLDELKREEVEFENENKDKSDTTIIVDIDNLLKRYKRYSP